MMAEAADDIFVHSPRPLSPSLYSCHPETGAVIPYVPNHPVTQVMVALGHEKLKRYEYTLQQKHLSSLPEYENVFIAPYDTTLCEDVVGSRAVWLDGRETLLPETTHVMLTREGQRGEPPQQAEVPFSDVSAYLTPVEGTVPPRYRTGAFPPDDEIEAMLARENNRRTN